MKRVTKWISELCTLSAMKLGAIVTLIAVFIALNYYQTPSTERKNSAILELLSMVHQKSIDFRLRARGEVPPGDNVALITVDEKALEALGRWPWSRKKIADMIERLRGYGAKVIGFDAVFSEPENVAILKSLKNLKNSPETTTNMASQINDEILKANTDLKLAKTIERHAEHLVMGGYWDYPNDRLAPYQELCGNIVLFENPQYQSLESDERHLIPIDKVSNEIPEILLSVLEEKLANIATDITNKFGSTKTASQKVELQKAISKSQIEYCGAWLISGEDSNYDDLKASWPALQEASEDIKDISFDEFVSDFRSSVPDNALLRNGKWWINTPVMNQGTKYTAYFNAELDSDGTIRRSPLVTRWGEMYLASLALKTALIAKGLGGMLTLAYDPVTGRKVLTELALINPESGEIVETIPVDGAGNLIINYAGPSHTYPHLSVAELFNDKETAIVEKRVDGYIQDIEVNKSAFIKNKIFLFGATATGIFDLRVTPFEENFPGLETHANVLDNLLQGNFLVSKRANEEPRMLFALLLGGLLLSFLLSRLGAVSGLLLTGTTFASVYLFDSYFLFDDGALVNVTLPLFLIGTLYVAITFFKYLTEERKKQELKGTFQKYVSPSVVNEILKDPHNLELGGKKEVLTVLFSDIRSFTTISEKLDPQVLSELLNTYLTPMTRLVFENKGTLDKYMGDAIMAFFGAPISFDDHAESACRCALQTMSKLKTLNETFVAKGWPEIEIGIGINTGEMSVGNMGSDIVQSYTVMGDSVNLGARLEGINKQYGTNIIISEFTQLAVKDRFVTREVDWVRVKGKSEPVKIFELVAEKDIDVTTSNVVSIFGEGLKYYHERDFDRAQEAFTEALKANPDDAPSRLYIKRCANYIDVPPEADWDGVFEMKTK